MLDLSSGFSHLVLRFHTGNARVTRESVAFSSMSAAPLLLVRPTVILTGMTYRVGPKGQVVLPKALRDRHGIEPGDEVVVDENEHVITIRKARPTDEVLAELAGALKGLDTDLLAELEAEHRREIERDERKREASGL
jgi:AbrB family looped-hinge helix DNA binding protein